MYAGLIAVLALPGVAAAENAFIGRVHPILVHLPIGLLVAAALLSCLPFAGLSEHRRAVAWIWTATSVSAVFACASGWLLALEGGYDPVILTRHRWSGVALAAGSTIAAMAVHLPGRGRGKTAFLYRAGAVISFAALLPAGHFGGTLTHGSAYLAPLFSWTQQNVSLPAAPDSDFERVIYPILETHCIECHRAEKKKGDLRLDSYAAMLQPGESGYPAVVPGKPHSSELLRRIIMPESDPDVMPPEGDLVPAADILAISHWISEGAPAGDSTEDLQHH